MHQMIVDGFTFFNELDVLDVRLHTLKDVVDRFVLVESIQTFAGKPKPLYFEENKSLFKKFPITHIVVDDMPDTENRWDREIFQRNAIERGLGELSGNDWVLISDVDEIPFPQSIVATPRVWSMTTYYYDVNHIIDVYQEGPVLGQFRDFTGAQKQRDRRYRFPATHHQCWHFSFFGGVGRVTDKIHAFSHAEYDTPEIAGKLKETVGHEVDLFGRGYAVQRVPAEGLPPYITRGKFPHWFVE